MVTNNYLKLWARRIRGNSADGAPPGTLLLNEVFPFDDNSVESSQGALAAMEQRAELALREMRPEPLSLHRSVYRACRLVYFPTIGELPPALQSK